MLKILYKTTHQNNPHEKSQEVKHVLFKGAGQCIHCQRNKSPDELLLDNAVQLSMLSSLKNQVLTSNSKDWHCAPPRKTCEEKSFHKDLCCPLLVDMGALVVKETTTYSGQVVARITGFSTHCLQIPCIHCTLGTNWELFVQTD